MTEPIIEDEDGDLIPKELIPTDPSELSKEVPTETTEETTKEIPEEAESPIVPEETIEKSEVPSQPAPVEGETPKERALRFEVQRLRGINRKNDVKKLIEPPQPVIQADDYQVLRDKGYTEEEITNMEMAVDLIASKKGYVRADQNYATSVQDTVDIFTEEHPEYKQTNDAEDVRWSLFQSILKDGTYNLFGKTPKQLKSIFEKVDTDVKKELGEVVAKTRPAQIAAAQHKIQVASHGGGTKPSQSAKPKINPTEAGGIKLKGFTAEDFE